MKIFITGDLHGTSELIRFKTDYINFKNEDIILQLGDAGIVWTKNNINEENKWLNWYEKNIKAKLICILGNHENYERIYSEFETVNIYGAECYKIKENIFFVKNGEILIIDNKTFIALGGAYSIDKINRKEYIDWWPQEQMTFLLQSITLFKLKTLNNKVDYVLSHTAPESIIKKHFKLLPDCVDNTCKFLEEIKNTVDFKKWYFGHFHEDKKIDDKFTCLYKTIEELK